jgi:acyl-CoA synthetase (NDP forming)
VARRLARRKPVVVLKSRTRPPGLSGSGTGPGDRGLQALFESSGVIRVGNLDQLFDVAQLLAYQPLPAGRRVAIVGNSSALGVLAADACAAEGLEVVEGWPADLGSAASPEALAAELHRAALDPRVDAVLVVFIPVIATPHTAYADVLVETAARVHLPVVSTFLAASGVPERLRQGGPAGLAGRGSVPSYPSPEDAAYALGRVAAYAEWRRTPGGQFPSLPGVDEKAARAILNRTLAIEMAYVANGVTAVEPVTLEQPDAAALLKAYGIDVWPVRHCAGLDEAVAAAEVFGYPVVVKAADEALRHRVDLGGVRLDVRSADEVRAAFEAIAARSGFSGAGVLVQPMAPRGVACVVEVAQDSAFGPVVGFGLGGVATDLLGDRAWRSVPLTDADAHALVRAPLAAPMLFGHRGASPVDARALEELLLRVGMLADEIPELRELELHPVLVGDAGLTVLHATVRVAPPTPRHDAGPRRLR